MSKHVDLKEKPVVTGIREDAMTTHIQQCSFLCSQNMVWNFFVKAGKCFRPYRDSRYEVRQQRLVSTVYPARGPWARDQ